MRMATVTRSEAEHAQQKGSQEDAKRILEALLADGAIAIIDDPEVEPPAEVLDEEGNPVTDEEGNPVLEAPAPQTFGDVIQIQVDAEDAAAEEAAAAAEEEQAAS